MSIKNERLIIMEPIKVYCVVNAQNNKRLSQFYSRVSDAKLKAKKMNGSLTPWVKSVSYTLSEMEDIP